MNLPQLYYFKKLAELEHYTRAAKELYISQPALSEAIHSLEKELGVPLFKRVGRNVQLTKYGSEFYGYVSAGLAQIDNGVARAKSYSEATHGTLNVGSVFTVQGGYLPALLNAFRVDVSGEVTFNIYQGFTVPLVAGLRRGDYDAIFAAKPDDTEDLDCVEVVAHELTVVVNENHPLAQQDTVSFDELKPYEVFTYRGGSPIGDEVNGLLEEHGIKASRTYEDEISIGGVIAANEEAAGLCTYTIGLSSYKNVKELVVEEVPRDFHKIYLITPKSDFRPYVLDEFIRFTAGFEPPEGAVPHLKA